ncbi:hypothetical protein [Sphingobacterium arenae]|uniref:Uncharacterized protein n=1 Tax=Sphingobacterium arenae TaxID=1280598 RepID=A0ABR7XZQ4_9SPHI|nr:hypothetical protein [Sphingobacterium arenae]MBD1424513.1 hypothetical protein [Sphingobacterium arenae]
MKKLNRPKKKDVGILQERQTYIPPMIQGMSIEMEYSIASGSGAGNIGSGSVNEQWDQESTQSKEINW